MDALKEFVRQPYWVIALILGVILVVGPCVTINKDVYWTIHTPNTYVPVWVGIVLLGLSSAAYWFKRSERGDALDAGLDLSRVRESNGVLWTTVAGCEIRVEFGRIENYVDKPGVVVALPCNEYFDDRCVSDTRSALGAYVNRVFTGQVTQFVSLMKDECGRKLGKGVEEQKTDDERAESFGAGRCILLTNPLNRSGTLALVSTTTQRAGQGLAARISYLFVGMGELVARLADARISDVVMPVLGAGHGGIDQPLAFVGLVLAVAESARYRQGGHRLRRVTIVVFRKEVNTAPEVDVVVVRRALALIGTRD